MQNKSSAAPLIFGACFIALIAGVTGWALHSDRNAPAALARDTGAEPGSTGEDPRMSGEASSATTPPRHMPTIASLRQNPQALFAANNQRVAKLVSLGKQKLVSQYQSEQVNPAWASRKQKALEGASTSPQMAELNAIPTSFNARCHSSVCLIEADFATRYAADDWYTLYTLNAASDMSNAAMEPTTNPDGSTHLEIYGLARSR